jgi:hypothetical protein
MARGLLPAPGMNQIFAVVLSLLVLGCAGGPRSVSMSVSQDAESQALVESVAWVTLHYRDSEGADHGVIERPVQGFRAGLDLETELPEGLSADEDGHWVAEGLDDQRLPVLAGEGGGDEEEIHIELGAVK